MPVAVYLLEFSSMQQLSAQYAQEDVMELFDDVNALWSRYGLTWDVESVQTMYVTRARFSEPVEGFSSPREFRNAVADIIPAPSTAQKWRVYLVNQFPVNGSAVYIIEKGAVLYGELNKKGERHPVILAHELGHSLGLRHVSNPENLMYAGPQKDTAKTRQLGPQQIIRAKRQAGLGPFQRNPRQ